MQFETDIFTTSTTRATIGKKSFLNRENYLFYLRKVKIYILPYADILAWCLMPNHFHLMVLINEVTVGVAPDGQHRDKTVGVAQSDTDGGSQKCEPLMTQLA